MDLASLAGLPATPASHDGVIWGIPFAGLLLSAIVHTFNYKRDFHIPAAQVTATEEARTLQLARHV